MTSGTATRQSAAFIPGLDFIRCFAVLNVTLFHYTGAFGKIFGWHEPPLLQIPYSVGVPAFFILTGYLIPAMIAKRPVLSSVYFRYARLLPALVACSLVTYLSIWLYPVREEESQIGLLHWLANMTMLPKALGFEFLDGAYWTLQSQMFFFLFLCGVKLAGLFRYLVYVFIGVLLFALCAKQFELLAIPFSFPTPYKQITNIALSFLQIGVIHFFAIGFTLRRFRDGAFGPPEILLIGLAIGYELFFGTRVFFMFILLIGVSVLAIFKPLGVYQWTPVRFLARISYCYYLLHMVIGFTVITLLHHVWEWPATLVVLMTMTFIGVLAALIERYIERPLYKRLRKKPPAILEGMEQLFAKKKAALS